MELQSYSTESVYLRVPAFHRLKCCLTERSSGTGFPGKYKRRAHNLSLRIQLPRGDGSVFRCLPDTESGRSSRQKYYNVQMLILIAAEKRMEKSNVIYSK